jgi:hypothetical protein
MTEEEKMSAEQIANKYAMARFSTPTKNGYSDHEYFHELKREISEYARQMAIGFAEWLSGEGYQQYDGADRWISPSQSRSVYETPTLYTMFLTTQKQG